MSNNWLGRFVVLAVTGLACRGLSQEEQCVVSVQAPEGSPWKDLGVSPRKVSLQELQKGVDKYGLTLVEGTPPPHVAESLIVAACDHRGDMWVALPSHQEDTSAFNCWFERFVEKFYKLLGKMKRTPDQTPGETPRKYMKNYCGRDLPITSSSDARIRMAPETRKMQQKLDKILA